MDTSCYKPNEAANYNPNRAGFWDLFVVVAHIKVDMSIFKLHFGQ
jgi:hypothetical protein